MRGLKITCTTGVATGGDGPNILISGSIRAHTECASFSSNKTNLNKRESCVKVISVDNVAEERGCTVSSVCLLLIKSGHTVVTEALNITKNTGFPARRELQCHEVAIASTS